MGEVANIPQLRFPEFDQPLLTDILLNLTDVLRCGIAATPKYVDSGITFLSSQNVTPTGKILMDKCNFISEDYYKKISKNAKLLKGDILYSRVGARYGNAAIFPFEGDYGVYVSLTHIRASQKLDNTFLKFLLNSPIGKTQAKKGVFQGGGVPNLNVKVVEKFKINFPSKPEQQKIAAFLTAVDAKIEQLIKKKELLDEYKKGLMQQIFSQAIRFHSKGTSSQAQGEIDDTPGQPLLPNGNSPSGSDFPDWEEKKLGDITDLITKGTTPTSVGYNFTTEGINFIKVESIKNFKIDIGSVPKISEECHHHLKRSQLKNNDIVFSIAGTLGRTAIVKNKDLPANTNQALSIIRLNRSQHILFVHYLLNLESIDKYIHRMLSVGAQPNLSLQQVGDIQLQLPSLLEQSKITNFLSFIDSKIEQVGKQLDESKQFKKALLQQMFI